MRMIGSILKGTKEVVVEIVTGLLEAIADSKNDLKYLNEKLDTFNVKMMGSYTEIEALKNRG